MTTQDQVRLANIKNESVLLDFSVLTPFTRALSQLKKNLSDRKTYRNLAQLPDYMLKDIGVSREALRTKLESPWWEIKE